MPNVSPQKDRGLGSYLAALNRCALLSAEEERTLVQRYRTCTRCRHEFPRGDIASRCPCGASRDLAARARLVESVLRYGVTVARKYAMMFGRSGRATGLLEVLVSAANLGVLTAVDQFEPAFGTRLITYADLWIREKIRAELDTMGLIRISKARQAQHRSQKEPSAEPLITFEDTRVAEALPGPEKPEEHLLNTYGRDLVQQAISELDMDLRDKYVLLAYVGLKEDPKTLDQIAARVGLSGEGVRKVKRRGLELLRQRLAARDVNGSTDVFTST